MYFETCLIFSFPGLVAHNTGAYKKRANIEKFKQEAGKYSGKQRTVLYKTILNVGGNFIGSKMHRLKPRNSDMF